MNDFYVYVYIDPRNFEDFYYGKGKGKRKFSHLNDKSDSQKVKRIKEIQKEGLEPIIRVIARNLSEKEAFLIEASFLWKMGRYTANLNSGHISKYFRPLNTLYKEIPDFDYSNGLYFFNVGVAEPPRGQKVNYPLRNWDDSIKYGFISAGQKEIFKKAIKGLSPGDVVVAFISGHGYVGVGKIKKKAEMIRDVFINNERILDLKLKSKNLDANSSDPKNSEYVALVDWIVTVPKKKAKWINNSKLFSPRLVRADLTKQRSTIDFINKQFKIDLESYLK